jgi:hypothetical protein
MKTLHIGKWVGGCVVLTLLWGCGAHRSNVDGTGEYPGLDVARMETREHRGVIDSIEKVERTERPIKPEGSARTAKTHDVGWMERRIGEAELLGFNQKEPDLSPSAKLAILARLNTRAKYYIDEDIRSGQALKVPNDFSAFRHWTPLPKFIPETVSVPKFVLVVKDIPFIGWYERGRLVGDTYVCIGKEGDWTKAGIYKVLDKDVDHISRSYTNAYGRPAPMPWALRIYEHVWIHAGDITGGYCSHGCINLPLTPAVSLFDWADSKTVVVVLSSLNELSTVFEQNQSNCRLYAHRCELRPTAMD